MTHLTNAHIHHQAVIREDHLSDFPENLHAIKPSETSIDDNPEFRIVGIILFYFVDVICIYVMNLMKV